MNKTTKLAACCIATTAASPTLRADTFGSGSNAFTIDFVTIGAPGNPVDTGLYMAAGLDTLCPSGYLCRLLLAAFAILQWCVPLQRCVGEEVVYSQPLESRPFSPIIQTRVGEGLLNLILDTGTPIHVLDKSIGELKGGSGRKSINTFGRLLETTLFDAPQMSINGWAIPSSSVAVMDVAGFRSASGVDVRGLLSAVGLNGIAVDFNFDERRLRLLNHYSPPSAASLYLPSEDMKGTKYIPLGASTNREPSTIQLIFEGRLQPIMIDTGSNDCVGLPHDTFEALVANGTIIREKSTNKGVREILGGSRKAEAGRFAKGNILGIDLKMMPVVDTGSFAILGMQFLLNFNFVLDYSERRFYFARRVIEPPLRQFMMLGAIMLFSDGQCVVAELHSGGGAVENAGIRKGDIILKLGYLNKSELSTEAIYALCEASAKQMIEVEFLRPPEDMVIKATLALPDKIFSYPAVP